MIRRPAAPLALSALLLCACTPAIHGGPNAERIADDEIATPAPPSPPAEDVTAANTERALRNYQKLLDLPQTPAARAETMRRLADLQLQQVEAGGASFEQGEQHLRKSVSLYEALLAEQPGAPGNDRVLYQLSRAYQDLGETARAEAVLTRLGREFPQSRYSSDAHFRRAELLFRLGDFEAASVAYRRVLELGSATPFFEPAQYKYGWSQYRLSNHEAALATFLAILDRELPPGELSDPQTALAGARPGKQDTVKDALRVATLSLVGLGGGDAAAAYFARNREPAYAPLLYLAVADELLAKKRFTDAAAAQIAFINAHPRHPLAPAFHGRAVTALQDGGFAELVVQQKERFVAAYDPAAPYWAGGRAAADVLKALRAHLEDLARHHQAGGQKVREQDPAAARPAFVKAASYYRRLLELFPQDAAAAEMHFLMAEAWYDGGESLTAAREYARVVEQHPSYPKAPEAAHAAVLAHYRHAAEVPADRQTAALEQAVQAALQLADRYPNHPQAPTVLTRAAEDLYRLQSWDAAIGVAARMLDTRPPAPEALRRTCWSVVADARFSQGRFAEAEAAYAELLELTPVNGAGRSAIEERLASAIYRQGEAARAANDLDAAAGAFLRVGRAAPGAGIRAASQFDAAAALIALGQWERAAGALEGFRTAFPGHALLPDVDKKLAVAYQSLGKLKPSAAVLKRIAERREETAETRQEAAWLAASLLDEAGDARAAAEYEAYLKLYPQPPDRAMEARQHLAQIAEAARDETRHTHWLREMVRADAAAGAARSPYSRLLAGRATLEFGRRDARAAAGIPLRVPLNASLPAKKQAMERAIASLTQAAESGIGEVTTAATFELGELYLAFGKALLGSDLPPKLSALEREQYRVLLEEQAFPFEEKAIGWHEANLRHVAQGVNNEWVARSLQTLVRIAPGRYGKHERAAEVYEAPSLPAGAAPSAVERYGNVLALLKGGRWQEAEPALTAHVRDFPQDASARTNLGIVHARAGRKPQAVAELTRAAAGAGSAVAHNWLGVLARESGDLGRAEQAYRLALQADPACADAHLNLGILYDQYLHRPQDAVVEYRRYREGAGKDDPKAAIWIAELERALPVTRVPAAVAAPATMGGNGS